MNSKPTIRDYEVRIAWDEREGYFVAEIPEIPTCAADGSTQAEALANLEETFAVLKEAYHEEGLSFPYPERDPVLSSQWLAEASEIVKMPKLADLAGIPVQTLASRLKRGTPLTPSESRKIDRILRARGLRVR